MVKIQNIMPVKSRLMHLFLVTCLLLYGSCSNQLFFCPYLAKNNIETSGENIFYRDIPYDTKPLNKFDIIIPKSNKKVPLVIFIHGGGFTGGDKADVYDRSKFSAEIKELTSKGIAYATINYRLLGTSDASNVMSCLNDSKRCLQFIRHHAKDFNIDENRIGLYGGSAGAGTSLWLGMSEEMQKNNSTDPVEKKSTRVKAVAAYATQASYDLYKWDEIFADYSMTDADIVNIIKPLKIVRFYGISSLPELETIEILKVRKNLDLGDLITADDPPLWIQNPLKTDQKPSNLNELYHHYKHGEYLYKKAQNAGINVYSSFPAKTYKSDNYTELASFFIKYL